MKRVLITGTSGFVGSRVARAMHPQYQLLTPSHSELDITSRETVKQYIQKSRPDYILHLAAISNTGYCEEHPDDSFRVNVIGVEHLAMAATRYGAKLVFFSSDQVYNGNHEEGLLSENIPVSPENHYGRHKLLAEERALQSSPEHVALRATWMYDNKSDEFPTHNNFVTNIKEAIRHQTPLRFATREYRGITWINEVIRNIPYTLQLPGGTYNFGAENTYNTYDTALAYLDILHCNKKELIIADHERFPTHIRNLSISMAKATEASNGNIQFSNTIEGLRRFEEIGA